MLGRSITQFKRYSLQSAMAIDSACAVQLADDTCSFVAAPPPPTPPPTNYFSFSASRPTVRADGASSKVGGGGAPTKKGTFWGKKGHLRRETSQSEHTPFSDICIYTPTSIVRLHYQDRVPEMTTIFVYLFMWYKILIKQQTLPWGVMVRILIFERATKKKICEVGVRKNSSQL